MEIAHEIECHVCHVLRQTSAATASEAIFQQPRKELCHVNPHTILEVFVYYVFLLILSHLCHTESYYHDLSWLCCHAMSCCLLMLQLFQICMLPSCACLRLRVWTSASFGANNFCLPLHDVTSLVHESHGPWTKCKSNLACFDINKNPDWCSKGKAHRQERCSIPCCAD